MAKPEGAQHGLESLLGELRRRSEHLLSDLAHAELKGAELMRELQAASQQVALMANLYVQLTRLHASLKLADVVAAVDETLVNLVGTEDYALFLRDESGRFERLSERGPSGALPGFALGEGVLGGAAALGNILYDKNPLAALPLRSGIDGGTIGMVVISSLLTHKGELSALDRALFDVYAEHAGLAIEAALCAEAAGAPVCRVAELRALLGPHVDPASRTGGAP
jgi:hypothetical protein